MEFQAITREIELILASAWIEATRQCDMADPDSRYQLYSRFAKEMIAEHNINRFAIDDLEDRIVRLSTESQSQLTTKQINRLVRKEGE